MKQDRKLVVKRLKENYLMPVVRVYEESEALKIADILIETGLRTIEITMSVPSAEKIIESLVNKFHDDIVVGAGTVLTLDQAKLVYNSGAQFLVSPIFKKDVVTFCKRKELTVIPGASTPREIYMAHEAGADAVKIFPSVSLGGPKFLGSMKAIYPNIDFVPTGGINLSNITDFIKAGATMVGVGSALINTKLLKENKIDEIKQHAQRFLAIVQKGGFE